jgi:hypothetical protein
MPSAAGFIGKKGLYEAMSSAGLILLKHTVEGFLVCKEPGGFLFTNILPSLKCSHFMREKLLAVTCSPPILKKSAKVFTCRVRPKG